VKLGVYVQTWHVGGVATFCDRLALGLKKLGHEPLLLLATPYGKRDAAGKRAYGEILRANAYPVQCLHLNSWHPRERPWRAAEKIAAGKLDALFLSSHAPLANALGWLSSKSALIGIAHTDDEDTYGEFRATQHACQAYTAVSASICKRLGELAGKAERPQLKHIPYGVPVTKAEPAKQGGLARVLVVSRLNQNQKRVLELPQIWKAFREKGGEATLTICGPGEEEASLRQELEMEIKAGSVSMRGGVPLEGMPEIYEQNDIMLSVSAYEGLPIAVLEATTHGLYPILSDIRSGHREIIETAGEGKLCPVGDVKAFATALSEATRQISSIRLLRGQIQQKAQARFSLENMVREYESLAREVTARGRASASTRKETGLPRPTVDPLRRWIRKWQYSRHYHTDMR